MNEKAKSLSLRLVGLGLVILGPIMGAVSCYPLHGQSTVHSRRTKEFPPPVLSVPIFVCSDGTFGEMILSQSNPTNAFIGVELVTITADSATLRILRTGQYVSAKTNKYFVGSDFGNRGLLLLWVSKEKGQIGVERRWGKIEKQIAQPQPEGDGKPAP